MLKSEAMTSFKTLKGRGKNAFTLAEVLITLAIIGVVAAMTIPTLISDYQSKSWRTASSVFNRRLGEALKIMNANSALAGHDSTAEFIEELSKHIKIVKICDKNNLSDCFATEILIEDSDPIDVNELKSAKNLQSEKDFGNTDTMGIMFADGVSALIAYNKNAEQDPLSNQIVRLSGGRDSVGLGTEAISILYDVNGLKSPNKYSGHDIKGINISIKTGAKVQVFDTELYYWEEAIDKCASLGMSLPARGSYDSSTSLCKADAAENTLCGIYNNKSEYGFSTTEWYWTSEEHFINAWQVSFYNGSVGHSDTNTNLGYVVCVGN